MAVTMEQLQQELASLKAQVDGITAPPTDYYTSRWSGEEIDNGVARAMNLTAESIGAVKINNGLAGDCNLANIFGRYYVNSSTVNGPVTPVAGDVLFVVPWDSNTVFQIYGANHNGLNRVYYRFSAIGDSKTWGRWMEFATTSQLCNPNLLDNWYFVGGGGPGQFPVNQRGVSAGTAGWSDYFIDRYLGQCTYKLLPEGLEIQAGGYLVQRLDILPPLPATYAFLATTGLWFVTFTQYGATAIPGIGFAELNQSDKYIALKTDTPLVLQAQKLELGDNQTLAHQEGGKWVPNEIPNYAEQLARCQRYALVLGDDVDYQSVGIGVARSAEAISVIVPIPTTMRALPAVSLTGVITARHGDGQLLNITGAAAEAISGGSLMLRCATVGATPGDAYDVFLTPKDKLILSADL